MKKACTLAAPSRSAPIACTWRRASHGAPFAPIEEAIAAIRDGQHRRRRRRRGSRERRRPHDRGREGHAGRHQLHGHARPRPGVPGDDAGAARRAGDPARGAGQLVGARDGDVRVHRRARQDQHRDLGRRSRGDDADRDRAGHAPAGSAAPGPRVPAAGAAGRRARARRATPRRPSIWRGWPGSPVRRDLRDHDARTARWRGCPNWRGSRGATACC